MKQLDIRTSQGISRLLIGESIENLAKYLPDKKTLIITDENVYRIYKNRFPSNIPVAVMGLGEQSKTMATMEELFEKLVEYELDRGSFIVGIGGGIVCDVTGFVASTYMRGLRFAFVSTTLLSQVDASIGGKNGVNFKGFKNMIGVFNQPEFVILDLNMLKTLPDEEYIAAYAEIIKHAAISNKDMFEYLEKNYQRALNKDAEVIQQMVYDSLVIKSTVVQADEKETGLRRILNFGHTLGHAVEKLTGVIHGYAVSIGMVAAARLSVNKGYLKKEDADRLEKLIKNFGLPTETNVDKSQLVNAMKKDKKRENNVINFVLLEEIGKTKIEGISIEDLETLL